MARAQRLQACGVGASVLRDPALINRALKDDADEVVSSYNDKESRNNKPIYGYIMLPNLSPSPNIYKVQSVYNNNVAS